jgi:GNAT superfamily N-acetyltransferase
MGFQLRPVSRHDVPALTDLVGQLGYPTDEASIQERLGPWLDDPWSWLIGADDDGVLVGFAAMHVSPLIEANGKAARLGALVVDERYRSQGVGQALVAAFEEQARAVGSVKLEITSSRYRTRTHEFYKLLGYEDICSTSARFIKKV